jgi:prepilin-type N-terminal cleavage/methylation domain-containing protein
MTKNSQKGFTIVELLVATLAFSIILLVASNAIVEVGKLYYKGIIQSRTQETVRNISDEITRSFQFADGIIAGGTNNATQQQFCINDTRYTYQINQKVINGALGLRAFRPYVGVCGTTDPTLFGRELLATNMRLLNFPQPTGPDGQVYRINIRIAYGDNDLLNYYPDNATDTTPPNNPAGIATGQCKTGIQGSNFCAVASLDNLVKKRLN